MHQGILPSGKPTRQPSAPTPPARIRPPAPVARPSREPAAPQAAVPTAPPAATISTATATPVPTTAPGSMRAHAPTTLSVSQAARTSRGNTRTASNARPRCHPDRTTTNHCVSPTHCSTRPHSAQVLRGQASSAPSQHKQDTHGHPGTPTGPRTTTSATVRLTVSVVFRSARCGLIFCMAKLHPIPTSHWPWTRTRCV